MREFWKEKEEPIRQKPFFVECPFFYMLADSIYKDIDKDKLLEAIQNRRKNRKKDFWQIGEVVNDMIVSNLDKIYQKDLLHEIITPPEKTESEIV